VYGYLLKFFKMNGFVRLKAETIGNDLRIPVKKVSTYTKELENKNLIKSKRTGKANEYEFLPISDSPHAVESDSPHAVESDSPHAVESLYNREAFREAFRESEKKATPDFLKKLELWRSITLEYRRDLNKKQVVKCSIEKIEYAIERMNIAINKGGDPAKAFQNALKGDHAKFTQKMEDKAVAEQKEHDNDIVKLAEAANKKAAEKEPDKEKLLALVAAFKESDFGEKYRNHAPLAIIELRSFQSFVAYN